jgi:hypothetical protein
MILLYCLEDGFINNLKYIVPYASPVPEPFSSLSLCAYR